MKRLIVVMIGVLFFISVFAGNYAYAAVKASPEEKIKKKTDDPTVYVKEGGKKYHLRNCKVVPTGKKGIRLSEALAKGYEPCKVGKPPAGNVYINPSGKVYHKKSCKMVKKDAKTMTISDAKAKGLSACKICFPPQKEEK